MLLWLYLLVSVLVAPSQAFYLRNDLQTANNKRHTPSKMASDDKWADQADLYSNQASRLTELHGADLVTILKDDILKAKTILDVGCGTGAFAKAYLLQFPKGVPGQTLILSDLSTGMLDKARETIKAGPDCQTKIIFQEEDGTKLEGIEDNSVDLVVSLFGVFLIPDQEAALKAIQRVLKTGDDNVFANGSWMFDNSDYLTSQGFGVSLQDAFKLPNELIQPGMGEDSSIMQWATKKNVKVLLSNKARSTQSYQAMHNTVWEFDTLWTMLVKNPMSVIQEASDTDVARAKKALEEFVTQDGSCLDQPLMLSTVSILSVARGFGASP